MTPLVVNLLLFAIGLIVALKRPNIIPIYYSIWTLFGCYLTDLFLFPVKYEDYGVYPKYANIYIMCVFLYMCLIHRIKFKEDLKRLLKICIFFTLYILFICISRGTLSNLGGWIFSSFSWVFLYFVIENINISNRVIAKYIQSVLFVEIVICILQTLGYGYASFGESVANFSTISGTLFRYNFIASLLCVLIISLIAIVLNNKYDQKLYNYTLIIAGAIFVAISGARTELISLVLTLGYIFAIHNRKSRFYLIFFSTVLLFLYFIYGELISIEQTGDYGADASQRQKNILNIFTDSDYLLESSTFGLSFRVLLFMNYDIISLLFGSGLFYTTDLGYGGVSMKSGTLTDATLAIFIAETGIVGFFFLVRILCLFVKQIKSSSKIIVAFIIYFVIVTITDMGIFQSSDVIFMLFIIKYIKNKSADSYVAIPNYPCLQS